MMGKTFLPDMSPKDCNKWMKIRYSDPIFMRWGVNFYNTLVGTTSEE